MSDSAHSLEDAGLRPEPGPAGSRRALLGAAAAFALTASGPLLPAWLADEVDGAAAAKWPGDRVRSRADKRRQRRHHRLKQHRAQRRRAGAAQPGAFIRGVRTAVRTSYVPVTINAYAGTFSLGHVAGPITLDVGGSTTLSTADLNLQIMFDAVHNQAPASGLLTVLLRNPAGTPDVSVWQGGAPPIVRNLSLTEQDGIEVTAELYRNVKVKLAVRRDRDSIDFKEFQVSIVGAA